jgi:hypothetical protein
VADRRDARKRLELPLVEDVGDEPHLSEDREPRTVGDGDPGRLLPAVLQREQPEVRQPRDVALLRPDAEHATHVSVSSRGQTRGF